MILKLNLHVPRGDPRDARSSLCALLRLARVSVLTKAPPLPQL